MRLNTKIATGLMLLSLGGCIYHPVANLSPPLTAPTRTADDGYFQWAVVAEVKSVKDAPDVNFCMNILCNAQFLRVSLNVSRILGTARNPVPTEAFTGNEYGDNPFYEDPGSHYLMFMYAHKEAVVIGVFLPILTTSDGQFAIPGEYLIPYWDKSGCGPYVKNLEFTGNPDLRMRQIGPIVPEYWSGEGYGARELQFGEIRHGRLIYTKGVLLKDMEAQAAKLFIGCGDPK